jgi:hypothetical protein
MAATGSRQSQWVFEGFYRFQMTSRIQFTPGYRLIVNPLVGKGDVVGVFEARMRVAFCGDRPARPFSEFSEFRWVPCHSKIC